MIAATVHDPHLFETAASCDASKRAALVDHLAHVAHSHLAVVDTGETLGCSLRESCAAMPSGLRKRLELALSPSRIIRKPLDAQRERDLLAILGRRGSAAALALQSGAVDAVVTDEEGRAGLQLLQDPIPENVLTLPEFILSDCHQRLLETMGAVATGDMQQAEFSRLIVAPVVKWAKKITVIDRYIASALYDDDPDERDDDDQWGRTRATLKFLYDTWEEHCALKKESFVIVTQPYRQWTWGKKQWHAPECPNPCMQAQMLAEQLDLGEKAQIELVSVPRSMAAFEHDRYLVTDREVVLTFSRGFDVIRPNERLTVSDISLHNAGGMPAAVTLLSKARTLARCRVTSEGWIAESP